MGEFESWQSYGTFSDSVRRKARHVLEKAALQFLEQVIASSTGRTRPLPADRFLWRAQLGHGWEQISQDEHDYEVPGPYSQERMKPLRFAAPEGRVNPKGIPCLYLSTDKETAMAEVRPWLNSYISAGIFRTLRAMKLLDCSVHHGAEFMIYFEEPNAEEKEKSVWRDIDNAFSEPVTASDSSADYAPTQVLAEFFRDKGFDGVVYKSALGKGFNIALFNPDDADLVNCHLFQAEAITFKFKESGNPYYLRKASPA